MRFLNTILPALLLIGIVVPDSKGQNLYIQKTDGSVVVEALSSVQTLTFETTDLHVNFIPGTTDVYALSDIRKLYFTANVTADEPLAAEATAITVYPNPANDFVAISNGSGRELLVKFFQYDGRLVLSQVVTEGKTLLSLAGFPSGLYLIQADGLTLKLIK